VRAMQEAIQDTHQLLKHFSVNDRKMHSSLCVS
jgi:hypothetical protein